MKGEQQRALPNERTAKTSRRGFLTHLAGAAVGGVLVAAPAGAVPSGRSGLTAPGARVQSAAGFPALPVHRGRKSVLDHFHYETFVRHLNSRFRAESETGAIELELVGARAGSHNDPARGIEQFSLTFRGPDETLLEQSTYSLTHAQLGEFPLFIVPVGRDEQGRYYQAVFNRIPRSTR